MAFDATAVAHLATLVNDQRSNCVRVTAENEELRRSVSDMDGKGLKAVLSAKQFQAKTSALTEEEDALVAWC